MPSLRDIAHRHAPLLVLDAASTRIQVGIWDATGPATWQASDDEAGVGLFRCIEQLGVQPREFGAFVFCEGPGSILGIRTAAMAVRTWTLLQPRLVWTYASLVLVAQTVGTPDTGVIADARRDSWHHATRRGALRRVPTAELSGDLVMPEHFRHWTTPPVGIGRVPYDVRDLFAQAIDADILHPTTAPDAFLHEEPNYVTWTPHVHRAP